MLNKENNTTNSIINALLGGTKQIILTGAPGTGKTSLAKLIAEGNVKIKEDEDENKKLNDALRGNVLSWKNKDSGNGSDEGNEEKSNGSDEKNEGVRYEFVQFHPSYDYTDFVEGLRPVMTGNEGNADAKSEIQFVKLDGIFKHFCREVAKYNKYTLNNIEKEIEKTRFYFIIDEINRADLSKVFGELMYCLETDKRGKKIQTQYQNLKTYYIDDKDGKAKIYEEDVFKDGFFIPKNVIVIGTMNDIDRSVESMDFALRRRFLWKEIEVTEETLENAFKDIFGLEEKVSGELASRVMNLNKNCLADGKNTYGLNKHYYISQGQFTSLPEGTIKKLEDKKIKEFLEDVFEYRIQPLLEDYVRGESKVESFIRKCKDALMMDEETDSSKTTEE